MILLPRLILTRQYALYSVFRFGGGDQETECQSCADPGGGGGGRQADDGPLIVAFGSSLPLMD